MPAADVEGGKRLSANDDGDIASQRSVSVKASRKGKDPPPQLIPSLVIKFDEWLPTLERAAKWNSCYSLPATCVGKPYKSGASS